jgi:hypothetical protein
MCKRTGLNWLRILFSGNFLKTLDPPGFTEKRELSDQKVASQE